MYGRKPALTALVLTSLMWGQQAFALDEAELRKMALFGILEQFLSLGCQLAPGQLHSEKYADSYVELAKSQEVEGDSSYDKYSEEMKKFTMKYVEMFSDMPADTFCKRLKDDYVAAGGAGEFVEKNGD